jgi:hypothetical protein
LPASVDQAVPQHATDALGVVQAADRHRRVVPAGQLGLHFGAGLRVAGLGGIHVFTDWTEAEVADAARGVLALLRAQLDGNGEYVANILDGAADRGERGLRRVAETLVTDLADMFVRLTVTVCTTGNAEWTEAAQQVDVRTLMMFPEIRAAVMAHVAGVQAAVVSGGAGN